ncbi:hypothetical protein [Nocardioides sp. GCM10030258]|uniref:hypothetical protein n=1 Tax=unclassified Nocardioides TaxID=2615069 RepID=UPI0036116427
MAEFAQLRIEAAERKAWTQAAEAAAANQLTAADALKAVVVVTPKEVATLEQKAAKAFEALMAAVDQRYVAAFLAARRLRIANEEAAKYDLPSSIQAHGIGYNVRADRFDFINERGSHGHVDWGHLKEPKRWVEAVIGPAGVQLERGTQVTSARRPERLIDAD